MVRPTLIARRSWRQFLRGTGVATLLAAGLMVFGIGLVGVVASSLSAAIIRVVRRDEGKEGAAVQLVEQLERLAALRRSGDLSDGEFTTAKRKLLGTSDGPTSP